MRTMLLAAGAVFLLFTPVISPDEYPEAWKSAGKGKTYVLYRKHDVREMSQDQTASCVGCAASKALELMHGERFSPEWLYGMSRKHFFAHISPKQGSYCGWAAQVIKDIGAVPSERYAALGYDLRVFSPKRANIWARGPPDSLDQIAEPYKSTFVKIETWDQLRDSISQGVPVIVGSRVGFGRKSGRKRSKSGMLYSRWWSKWNHAMVFCGVSDGKSKRALLLNSWGDHWIKGPKWLGDEPNGSFWITKKDAQKMLNHDDAWAILPIEGLPF